MSSRYVEQVYLPRYNTEFAVPAQEAGSAFVPFLGASLPDILCEQFERTVGNDNNCVSFAGLLLQIPATGLRHVRTRVRVCVHRYVDGTLALFHGALFHGPRCLARYDAGGRPSTPQLKQAA